MRKRVREEIIPVPAIYINHIYSSYTAIYINAQAIHIYYCKCDQVLHVQRLDQMRPFYISFDKIGLDQMD